MDSGYIRVSTDDNLPNFYEFVKKNFERNSVLYLFSN